MNSQFVLKISKLGKESSQVQIGTTYLNYISAYYKYTLAYTKNSKNINNLDRNNIHLILYGYLLSHNLEDLYTNYESGKLDQLIKNIDGSYVLFLLDTDSDKVVVYTDRTSSKKIFLCENETGVSFSNTISAFDFNKQAMDLEALLFYLANGYLLQGSLFKNISILPYAAKIEIINGTIKNVSKYWDFIFNVSADRSETSFIEEMNHLLQRSIKKRVSNSQKINLSLSGGYDSCAVLGSLLNSELYPEITVFNFAHNQSKQYSDQDVARKISQKFELNFIPMPVFSDGIISSLNQNATFFQGVANICEEIDAIKRFSQSNHNSDFFFGEEAFGTNEESFSSVIQTLKANRIYPAQNFGSNLKYCLKELQARLKNSNDYYSKLFKDIPEFDSFFDMKHYFYFRYRVCGVLTMWRDFFYGQHYQTVNPLLDYDILDLILQMPSQFRKNRILFKKTVTKFYPDIFSIPRAKYSNSMSSFEYYNTMKNEFISQKYHFNEQSILADFIDLKLLQEDLKKGLGKRSLYVNSYQNYLRKVLRKIHIDKDSPLYNRLCKEEQVSFIDFLKRVMVLHDFFEVKTPKC